MSTKSTRIASDELSAFATKGIERAIEARQAAGCDLTEAELDQVSGGLALALSRGIIAGGPWLNPILLNPLGSGVTNPAAGGLNTGLAGATLLG